MRHRNIGRRLDMNSSQRDALFFLELAHVDRELVPEPRGARDEPLHDAADLLRLRVRRLDVLVANQRGSLVPEQRDAMRRQPA